MVIDRLADFITGITLFLIMISIVEILKIFREKNYRPKYWVDFKKSGTKLFLLGIIVTLFYKLLVGSVGVICGTKAFNINNSGIIETLYYTFFSCLGFFGVALFEEVFFREFILQVIFKRLPGLLAIVAQGLIFGLIHYNKYSVHPHLWINIANAALIGIIFGCITMNTKSLMFAIGSHLIYNASEDIFFTDNSYKFTRFISFQDKNSLSSNIIGRLFYNSSIELIILSCIAALLMFKVGKDILYRRSNLDL